MTEREQPQSEEQADDVLERNIRESRKLLDKRAREREQGEVPRPPRDDPRYADQSVPPGQNNTPAGGTTGGEMVRDSG